MKFNNPASADEFKKAFEAAKQYNQDVKDGKAAKEAPEIVDVEDEKSGNIEVNVTADEDGEDEWAPLNNKYRKKLKF